MKNFSEGVAPVEQNDTWGCIDKKGELSLTDGRSILKVGNTEIFFRQNLIAPPVNHTKLVIFVACRKTGPNKPIFIILNTGKIAAGYYSKPLVKVF